MNKSPLRRKESQSPHRCRLTRLRSLWRVSQSPQRVQAWLEIERQGDDGCELARAALEVTAARRLCLHKWLLELSPRSIRGNARRERTNCNLGSAPNPDRAGKTPRTSWRVAKPPFLLNYLSPPRPWRLNLVLALQTLFVYTGLPHRRVTLHQPCNAHVKRVEL